MPSIRALYDCGEPLQGISLNLNQDYVAVASKTHILTYQLLPNLILSQQFHLTTEGGNNFKMTDVDWNQFDSEKIAASATSGSIAVFNLNSRSTKQARQEWESGEISRAVNRISWNLYDRYQLLSAHQDGQVKIWDTMRQKNACIKIMNGHCDACREARFDPFHPNILAAIYENGTLMIWDRRNPDHVLSRISAHAESGSTLEWSPNTKGLIASGSRDKTVKIWDINGLDDVGGDGERPISMSNTVRPLHVIHTPAPLESISWRPAERENSRRRFQIATTSSNESGRGDINVWDAANPNIPACVLRGHSDGCTGFQWLDTPPAATTSLYQHIISVGKDNKILVHDLRNGYFPAQHISGHVVAVSAMGHVAFQRGHVYRGDPLGLYFDEVTANAPGFFQDDPAFFGIPPNFLSSEPLNSVRGAKLGTSPLENTSLLTPPPPPAAAAPPPPLSTTTTATSQSGPPPPATPTRTFATGTIVVGMATINNIIESIECISGYSAEGGAFDPIVIKDLAQRYKTGADQVSFSASSRTATTAMTTTTMTTAIADTPHGPTTPLPALITSVDSFNHSSAPVNHSHWGYESYVAPTDLEYNDSSSSSMLPDLLSTSITLSQSVYDAVNACQWNCEVARSVGLAGHSMIWNALMSLIPVLMISAESQSLCPQGISSTLPETSSLDYAMETLRELLIELIDCGDCQHFVICCEILRNLDFHSSSHDQPNQPSSHHPHSQSHSHSQSQSTNPHDSHHSKKSIWKSLQGAIGEMRIREGYVAYLELLFRLGLFQISNSFIVRSTDKYITKLSQQGVIMRSSCAQCGKELNLDSTGSSSSTQLSPSRITSIWCLKCRRCVELCHLCQQPVKGLLHWCQICGHGGHPDCVKKWFQKFELCPSGCGHRCLVHPRPPTGLEEEEQVNQTSR